MKKSVRLKKPKPPKLKVVDALVQVLDTTKEQEKLADSIKSELDYSEVLSYPEKCLELCSLGVCELGDSDLQHPLLMGVGPEKPKLMIVGEAPGALEDQKGKPFIGKSGKLLRRLLWEAGVDANDCYITNVCKCRPPGNRTPTVKECKACKGFLKLEIEAIKPDLVLSLGNTPLRLFSGSIGITAKRGRKFWSEEFGVSYLPTYHPSAADRGNTEYERCLRQDIKKVARIAGEPYATFEPPNVLVGSDLATVEQIRNCILAADEFAFDLETSGLVPFTEEAHVLLIAFSWGKLEAGIIPICHPEHFWAADKWEDVLGMLKEIFYNNVPKIGHNIKFDVKWMEAVLGIHVEEVVFDTMLAHYACHEFKGTHGLKRLAADYLDFPDYDLKPVWVDIPKGERHINTDPLGAKDKKYFGDIPLDILGEYAAMDANATFRLKGSLQKELATIGVAGVFREYLMKASNCLTEMELGGIRIDLDYLDYLEGILDEEIVNVEKELLAYDSVQCLVDELEHEAELKTQAKQKKSEKVIKPVKPIELNFNSGPQVRRILFDIEGLAPLKETASGKYSSVDKEVLDALSSQSSLAAKLKERKHLTTLQNSFVRGLRKFLVGDRCYPYYLLHGTATGRSSCANPNFQQVPKEPWIKRLYLGNKDSHKWLIADYSQIELRVVASLSGDRNMLEIFRRGEDIHTAMASKIYGVPLDEVTKEQRFRAKTMNFAILYGRGAHSVAVDLDMSVDEAKAFISDFFAQIPGVQKWIKKVRYNAGRDGYVKSPLGRIRHLVEVGSSDRMRREESLRQAVNMPVQSAASDITFVALVTLMDQIKSMGLGMSPLGVIHDSISLSVPEDEVDASVSLVNYVMTSVSFPWMKVSLKVDIEVGDNWGEVKPYG